MNTMDLYTALIALAGIAGFVLEWRRDDRRDVETQQRLTAVEQQLGELQAWRDRLHRAQ